MHLHLKPVLLAGTVLAAVVAPAAAASAQSLTIEDGSADVWEQVWDETDDTVTWVGAGSQQNVDITKTVVNHKATKLVVRVKYAELKAKKVRFASVDLMRFDDGPKLLIAVDTNSVWRGKAYLLEVGSGDEVPCSGLDHTIDYEADTVVTTIPRSCLGDPKWVEVSSFGGGYFADAEGVDHNFLDNGQKAGHSWGGWSERIRQG